MSTIEMFRVWSTTERSNFRNHKEKWKKKKKKKKKKGFNDFN